MYKFLTSEFVLCIICNYWGLKGQMSDCIVLQYATCLTRQRAMSINSLTITLHMPLTHCKHPPMETKTFQMSDFATGHLRHIHKSHLLSMNISDLTWFGMISRFCHISYHILYISYHIYIYIYIFSFRKSVQNYIIHMDTEIVIFVGIKGWHQHSVYSSHMAI